MDDNGMGTLDYKNFLKVMRDYGVDVPEVDLKNAFKSFDLNRNGEVEYDELMKVIIGPMNKYRTTFVEKAYDKLDVN